MQLNGTSLVDRHNRPTVIQKVALRAFFINDGEYYDPFQVSGVAIFTKASNQTPSSLLDTQTGLLSSSILSSLPLMNFAPSAKDAGAALNPTSYNPSTDPSSLSGVYRVKKGEYICVLDGTQGQSGVYNYHGSALEVENTTSTVNDYIDVWTIKFNNNSNFQTLINDFHLYSDTFFASTQPLIFTTSNRLVNKHLTLSSTTNLKITTNVTIENKDVDESVKNIFKDSSITSAMVQIDKVNEDSVSLPARVTVSSYSDTSSTIDVTSDNTIVLSFDTTKLATHANVAQFGGLTGTYLATAKYTLLNETVITPPYYFTIS